VGLKNRDETVSRTDPSPHARDVVASTARHSSARSSLRVTSPESISMSSTSSLSTSHAAATVREDLSATTSAAENKLKKKTKSKESPLCVNVAVSVWSHCALPMLNSQLSLRTALASQLSGCGLVAPASNHASVTISR